MADNSDVASTSEFREGDLFETDPSESLRSRFLEHVRETGEPENFPGLCMLPISGDEPYSIVAEFIVDRGKRPNLDEIPCAICGPRTGKFLDGRLVWHPREKKIRIIGHECANAHLNSIAQEEYEKKQRNRANDNFLLENFFRVPKMLAVIDRVMVLAEEYQKVSIAFCAQAPVVQKALRKVARDNDGLLTVDVVVDDPSDGSEESSEDSNPANERFGPMGFRSSGGGAIGHTETIGALRGLTALVANYAPTDELSEARRLLEPYCHDNETMGLEALLQMSETEKALCVGNLRAAEILFTKAERRREIPANSLLNPISRRYGGGQSILLTRLDYTLKSPTTLML